MLNTDYTYIAHYYICTVSVNSLHPMLFRFPFKHSFIEVLKYKDVNVNMTEGYVTCIPKTDMIPYSVS